MPLRQNGSIMHRSTVDDNFEPKRAIDHSAVARINSIFLRYNWLFALVIAGLIAAGFDWKTPKSQFESLRQEILANRAETINALDSLTKRANTAEGSNSRIVDVLEIFSIDLCLRRKSDPYVYQRLKCDVVLRSSR